MILFDDDDGVADAFDVVAHVNVNAVVVAVPANGYERNCVSALSLVDGCLPGDA